MYFVISTWQKKMLHVFQNNCVLEALQLMNSAWYAFFFVCVFVCYLLATSFKIACVSKYYIYWCKILYKSLCIWYRSWDEGFGWSIYVPVAKWQVLSSCSVDFWLTLHILYICIHFVILWSMVTGYILLCCSLHFIYPTPIPSLIMDYNFMLAW
jgi:hypothetical protein